MKKASLASVNSFFLCTPSVPNGKGFFVLKNQIFLNQNNFKFFTFDQLIKFLHQVSLIHLLEMLVKQIDLIVEFYVQ